MRDPRFIAKHRGGLLTDKNHRLMIGWAVACAQHVLRRLNKQSDPQLVDALRVAKAWQKNDIATGMAMKASRQVHALARAYANPVDTALARSVGHAVATAHMADHALGAPLYALKALAKSGQSMEEERAWQISQLTFFPLHLKKLILETLASKEKHFRFKSTDA